MAACEPHSYSSVTPDMLEKFSQAVHSAFGIAVEGYQGAATAMGTTLAWDYDQELQQLTITCSARPVFLSCDVIYNHLAGMLDKCRT